MTIHSSHPFLPPDGERDPARQLRGRLGAAVTVWTAGEDVEGAAGLTVSSMLVAGGQPWHVLGLLDPDADLVEAIERTGRFAISVLRLPHRALADAFAGVAPAPGGLFRLGQWTSTDWGPVLEGGLASVGCRLTRTPRQIGWSLLVEAAVEHVEIGDDGEPLMYRRGRYFTV